MANPKAEKMLNFMMISLGLFIALCSNCLADNFQPANFSSVGSQQQVLFSSSDDVDLSQARILDYRGLVEVSRAGRPVRVRPNTVLQKTDQITVYYDSYLELYFDSSKTNIIRVEGENSFVLQDLLKAVPYGFETRISPNKKKTEIVMIFSEDSWTKKYLDILQEGRIPYTAVFVKEGVVSTLGLDPANPKEVLLRQGQMTYIFQGKTPFAAMPWEEYIDMCIEDCWGEW